MALRDELQRTLAATYTIEQELGGGGMSRVFLAEERALGRKVVVKVLPPELVAGVNVERFNREIVLAARLQHPHIVPVHSAGEMDGVPYYTMPFVEGESLRAKLVRSGRLSITETVSILRDVTRALGYAHERSIVHRDIKPDNVLLSSGSATVTDFGIAKAIAAARTEGGSHSPTLTAIGTALGTPAYMAPEQSAADPSSDSRADLYSLGCMAYEMLAGQPPFVAKTPQRLLAAHMSETPVDITTVRPDVPRALADLVMRCLEKDAEKRPQKATDVLDALESVARGGDTHAAESSTSFAGRGTLPKALAAYAATFILVAVAAKLATVAIGLPDWVFPGSLLVMALGLPAILFTGYVHHAARRALTATPTYTPGGSRTHGTMAGLALKASPHVSWHRAWTGGAAALGVFAALVGGYMLLRALGVGPFASLISAGALSKSDRILITDFSGSASDSALAPVVTEAFRTALGQSNSLSVVSLNAVRDALQRMQKPLDTKLDLSVGREIATRDGIKAIVTGEMLGVGGAYAIAVRLVSPRNGDELAAFRETAATQKDILPAIDRLAKQLRARIGESLRSVQAAEPLGLITTPSLEALRKYVQAVRVVVDDGDFPRSVSLFEDAIALDTGFAMAYRRLGVEYANRGRLDRARELLQKAYDHRDRMSEAEQLELVGTYYQYGPRQDFNKSNAAFEALVELRPGRANFNNLAINYRDQRRWAKAESTWKRGFREYARPAAANYSNLFSLQIALGQRADAMRTLASYDSAYPTNPGSRMARGNLLFSEGQYDSARVVFTKLLEGRSNDAPIRVFSSMRLGSIDRTRGRLAEARKWNQDANQRMTARRFNEAGLVAAISDAWDRGWFIEDRAGAVKAIDDALARTPLDSLDPWLRPYVDLVKSYALFGRVDKARTLATDFDRVRRDMVRSSDERDAHSMAGYIALAEKRYDDAIREFRASDVGPCTICALPPMAQAYDLAGKPDSAIAVFERYLSTPASARLDDQNYLAGTHKRLGELYEAKGDNGNALSHFSKFVELWKNADPELQPKVAEVRTRMARLRAER